MMESPYNFHSATTLCYSEPPVYSRDTPASRPKAYEELTLWGKAREGLNPATYSCIGFRPEGVQRSLRRVVEVLPRFMDECEAEAIAVRGSSGVLFAGMLMALLPELRVIVCRKPGENAHSRVLCNLTGGEPDVFMDAYVFLDDFVNSGKTLAGVRKDLYPYRLECTGIVQYQSTDAENSKLRRRETEGVPCIDWTL
jgi:hypothetical protein